MYCMEEMEKESPLSPHHPLPRHKITQRCIFLPVYMLLCKHFEANLLVRYILNLLYIWQTTERNEISASTHSHTLMLSTERKRAGSVTTGSRLEWSSIPHTAWRALYTDKTLTQIHTHTQTAHIQNSLRQTCTHALPNTPKHPNKTSIKQSAALHLAAVSAEKAQALNLLNNTT